MSNPITPQVAAGWYPDTAATVSGQQRWWDGTQWTEHTQNPYQVAGAYQAVGALKAPVGTNPTTIHIWLIVGLFALQMIAAIIYLATFNMSDYLSEMMVTPTSSDYDPFAAYGYLFTPGYFLTLVLGFVAWAGTVALAFFDSKALIARGVPKPFPWALAFIPSYGSMVYVIGRSVVARRRTGTGLGPMLVYIGLFALTTIGSIVWGIAAVGILFSDPSLYSFS